MPEKRRIRSSANNTKRQKGLVQGKAPHRGQNAHKVFYKWAYYRAALIWLSALGLLFLAVATCGFGIWQKDGTAIFAGIAIFVICVFMFLFASKATKCPLCRTNHFVNGKSIKHKKAYKIFPLSYSSTAVVIVALNRCIRCMHCGVTFDLTKKSR
ncbi:MAG: hypothetical protein ACI9E1_001859 [Cryomorphaceae bacterium]|jgi:hypothetical protein